MKIYFMRHGRSRYNDLGLCNDDPAADASLTGEGVKQAQTAAERLKGAALQRIYVSELPRTRQTAAIVNRHHAAPVTVRADLNDIRSGFNNRPVVEYQAAIAHDPLHARVNGGESLLEHKRRVLKFIDDVKQQSEQTVLVVAHEETLRVFAAHVRGLSDAEMIGLSFANCEFFGAEL
jgi:probable phosphoglycerate mutase